MTKKKQTHHFNQKIFIIPLQLAFIICFFLGIFWNPPIKTQISDENSWYYINRGYPIAWSGVSRSELSVDFPIIKAPFLSKTLEGDSYVKIIDLRIFLPLFIGAFILSYPIGFILSKAEEENNKIRKIILSIYALSTLGCIFFYFYWFPRI